MTARVRVLADDLSGAAEVAALFGAGTPVRLRAAGDVAGGSDSTGLPAPADPAALSDAGGRDGGAVSVLDLDTRYLAATDAEARVRACLAGFDGGTLVVAKVDSLLRGNLAAHLRALEPDSRPVVLAPSLPAAGRTVIGGVLEVHGVPLASSAYAETWAREQRGAPEEVRDALDDVASTLVDLHTVRTGSAAEAVRAAAAAGRVAICDAVTDDDLDRLVDATWDLPGVRYAGAGGLLAAIGRRISPVGDAAPAPKPVAARPVLFVVGTTEAVAERQIRELLDKRSADCVTVPAAALDAAAIRAEAARIAPALSSGGHAVLRAEPIVDPAIGSPTETVAVAEASAITEAVPPATVARTLAAVVAGVADGRVDQLDLVLTGGQTARAVLDGLGIDRLTVVDEIHRGAVRLRAPDGRTVVTRPGSFGSPSSFVDILDALRPATAPPIGCRSSLEGQQIPMTSNQSQLPLIAVTMGDGAGIGPEVCVGALLDDGLTKLCRPVVIGDAGRLQLAAAVLGVTPDIVGVDSVQEAEFHPGRINVIDLGLLPADLPWGQVSPVAGDAAYHYVRVAAELALRGEVSAICTAPLNKEALHAGGHLYPGHTEMLADLTGIEEVSMMLSTPKVKVVHVTTHIGLIDAIARIEPGLVERTIRRGHAALVSAGVPEPRIGVCGINPHAGENGLFGYGEEAEKIEPAIAVLRADGIDARGPLPADTAFFLAGRGDYDLIVAMYHDQGHGPVKVLGIDAGVNITVGLPVIRTSVDHGTAFDIAGTGTAAVDSMIEALRQAAEMSSAAVTA